MLCILCLTAPEIVIKIFDDYGLRHDISGIITKHFWLQPSADVDESKVICSSCWNALDAFHKFYEKIEEAHVTMANIKLANENDLKKEDPSGINEVDAYADLLSTGIKVEISEDTKVEQLEFNEELIVDPLEAITKREEMQQELKSDSESEIPLSRLAKRKNPSKTNEVKRIPVKAKKRRSRKKEVTDDDSDSKPCQVITPWQATCFAEETGNRVSTEEFDLVIKQNMDLSCNICCLPLANFFVLQEHYEFVHNERGYAACCSKKFDKRGALVDHLLLHKYPEYFKCDKCPKVLASRKNLKEHLKIHDKKLIYQCEVCKKSFHRKLLLERHMDIHVSERKFKCKECDKLFASKFSLGQHIYGVHKGGYTKICDQCGKVTRDKEAFMRHQLEHTGAPRPFVKCEKCGVKLANKCGLRRHMKAQHAETQIAYVCNVCGSVASSIFALRRHVTYMHKYERSHKCPMCDKGFKRALGLKRHRKLRFLREKFHKIRQRTECKHCFKQNKQECKSTIIAWSRRPTRPEN